MLFIGDIHITSKHADALLLQIRQYIGQHTQEEHIIFLGDYVYHFNYDRKALLQLFSLFIELAKQGKHLYIVAGNHDRITGHFVFEEARQTLLFTGSSQIHFITKPRQTTIEGSECLFLPYYYPDFSGETYDYFPQLKEENHLQRRMSWKINNILATEITERKRHKKTDRLLLIHHWYVASTKFPGQQAVFSFDSPALDAGFLEDQSIWCISGHLHQPFCHKRYLCTGSMWHTSPLEINQQKFLYRLDAQDRTIHAEPIRYNPYLQIPYPENPLSKEDIDTHITNNRRHAYENLTGGQRNIYPTTLSEYDLINTTITITTETQSLQDLPEAFDKEVIKDIGTIKHKLVHHNDLTLISELDRASLDLTNRFSDRKLLLRRFLEQKYGNNASRYISLLEQEKLIE